MLSDEVNRMHGRPVRFGDKPEVYLILRGMKRHIVNPTVLFSVFKEWSDVISLRRELEDQVPTGESITDLKLCYLDENNGRIYFLVVNDRSCYSMDITYFNHAKQQPIDEFKLNSGQYQLSSTGYLVDIINQSRLWMYFLPDDLHLSEISIPGTHDSMSFNTITIMGAFARCQYPYMSIERQLSSGVRYFDIRVDEDMITVHGMVSMQINFADVIKKFAFFVSKSREFLVVRIKAELSKVLIDRENAEREFFSKMGRILSDYVDYFVDTNVLRSDPKIEKLRGKIVLIDDMTFQNSSISNPSMKFWRGIHKNDVQMQDEFRHPEYDFKLKKITDFYESGIKSNKIRINHVSAEGVPFTSPEKYASYLNPKVKSYLNLTMKQHLGITVFDYVDEELCKSVIAHNSFLF